MIRKAIHDDFLQAVQALEVVKKYMLSEGIDQWDQEYPNVKVLIQDIEKG
ncbi:hypothetical protein [Chryseobacterium sp. Tr-659]|nr:hypothetical protein [Chryseobacterium sp. Tr-659]